MFGFVVAKTWSHKFHKMHTIVCAKKFIYTIWISVIFNPNFTLYYIFNYWRWKDINNKHILQWLGVPQVLCKEGDERKSHRKKELMDEVRDQTSFVAIGLVISQMRFCCFCHSSSKICLLDICLDFPHQIEWLKLLENFWITKKVFWIFFFQYCNFLIQD